MQSTSKTTHQIRNEKGQFDTAVSTPLTQVNQALVAKPMKALA